MIQNVSSNAASVAVLNAAGSNGQASSTKAAAPADKAITAKAVPAVSALNAQAFLQRQQIGAALYDRSFTLKEGARALKRQDAVQAYAEQIQMKEGGPTEKDLLRLQRKLDRAAAQIEKLSNNARGINLSSIEGIDGRDIDIVQANLAARINQGIKDGSLTEEEAKGLVARQQELADVETKLRESDGKLTAGEQKQMLDQLRKTADELNQLRNNGQGTNLGTYNYAESVDKRQAALELQLEEGLKIGALTEGEAETVRAEFAKVNELEKAALANGNVNWREHVGLSNAMNAAEIALYDLQRNTDGVKLADSYVDVKYVDQRQAQQLESVTRGIDRGTVTNEEGVTLLDDMQATQALENKLVAGGLTRGEYLRLQTEMNEFSLLNSDLQGNKERYTGIFPAQPPAPTPTPTPTTGAGDGAGAGNGATGGAGSASGTGNGAGNGTSPASGATGNPGTVPAPGTNPAAPVTNEAAKPVVDNAAVKPEAVAESAKSEDAAKAEAQSELSKFSGKYTETRDLFGELMTKVMKMSTDHARQSHESFVEKADARRRESSESVRGSDDHGVKSDGDKDAGKGFGLHDVERAFKLGSYAAVAERGASRPEPVISQKIA